MGIRRKIKNNDLWELYAKEEAALQWRLSDTIGQFLPSSMDQDDAVMEKAEEAVFESEAPTKAGPLHLNKIRLINNPKECIGRSTELVRFHELVQNTNGKINIVGEAGIGKTTLACAYLSEYQHQYQYLIWVDYKDNLNRSIANDPSLHRILRPVELETAQSITMFEMLNVLKGPNLMVIDNAVEQLLTDENFDLLQKNAHWKTILISREPISSPSMAILELEPQFALALFRNEYQRESDKEAGDLLAKIGGNPLHIKLVSKFLGQFEGLLSVQSLASLEHLNMDSIANYLQEYEEGASISEQIYNWLALGGEKEVIKDIVVRYLEVTDQEKETNRVISTWLDASGDLDVIELGVKRYLNKFAGKKEAQYIISAWLLAGEKSDYVKTAVIEYLAVNAQEVNSSFVFVAWLGVGGETELVKDAVKIYLNKNTNGDKTALVINAWLQAKGALSVVEQAVRVFLREKPTKIVSSAVIQNWLRANGSKEIVEVPMLKYLDKYTTDKSSGFVIQAWLEAGGEVNLIEHYAQEYLRKNEDENLKALLRIKQRTGDNIGDNIGGIKVNSENQASSTTNLPHNKGDIYTLIGKGKVKEALGYLYGLLPKPEQDQVVLLQSRINRLERMVITNVISHNDAEIERAQISEATLAMCNLVEDAALAALTKNNSKGVDIPEKEKNIGKRIFFVYSKHDHGYLEEFLLHLAGLRRQGNIAIWNDQDILPGEEWDNSIKEEIATADIILLLISANFLNTEYIWDVEIKKAMERHERKEARVIPIFIRPCDWSAMPFSKLNGLPSKAKPVSSYTDRDEAWVEVVKEIDRILDKSFQEETLNKK